MDMTKNFRLQPIVPAALACALLAGFLAVFAGAAPRRAAAASKPRAHAAASYLTGIGDQQTEMFGDRLWQQLHTRIARYIAPYDAAVRQQSLALARQWIAAAEAQHLRVLVAFYHSEDKRGRMHMPSVSAYQRDVQKFIKLFPHVREYQPWNEANRGNVPPLFASPTAVAAAKYYRAVKQVCRGCTVVGLDLLDQQNVGPSLRYLAEFKREVARLKTSMPTVWGLHNYSDTNRFSSARTRAVVAAVPGQVWLTETGGIVKFGGSFPNRKGSGLIRAARALSYMFRLASSNSHIKRLYIFQWSGSKQAARFDAGLTDPHYKPRPGYVIVCEHLHGAKCHVKTSRH
jgi:hypothetical protein